MIQFIRDLASLSSIIATSTAVVLATIIVGSVTILSLPLLLLLAPAAITALCLYATWQCMYPHVPAMVYGPTYDASQEDNDDYPLYITEDAEGYLVITDYPVEYPLALPLLWAIEVADESDEIQDSITSHYPSPCEDATFEADYATHGTDALNVSSPVLFAMDSEEETYSITESNPTLNRSCNLDHYSHDALVSLAKDLKIKGANARWSDATLIRKITDATTTSAAA